MGGFGSQSDSGRVFHEVSIGESDSRITMRYRPWTVIVGGVLSVLCFAGVLALWAMNRNK